MKLELKHLASYLPYELKGQLIGYPQGTTVTLGTYLSNSEKIWTIDTFLHNQVSLILKPLSQFEYDHIIQIKEHLGLGQWCDHYDQYFDAWFDDAESVQKLVLQCPYEIMQFFLECHFDVFGLIPNGLATELSEP